MDFTIRFIPYLLHILVGESGGYMDEYQLGSKPDHNTKTSLLRLTDGTC